MPIIGACFSNTRGSGYLVSFYENFKLLHFKITRRPNENPTVAENEGKDGQELNVSGANNPLGDVGMLLG
jgi:hypothetical protein